MVEKRYINKNQPTQVQPMSTNKSQAGACFHKEYRASQTHKISNAPRANSFIALKIVSTQKINRMQIPV